jgi:hypothetical protein
MNNGAEPHTKSSAGSVPLDRSTLIRELIGLSWDRGGDQGPEDVKEAERSPRPCYPRILYDADCDRKYAVADVRFNGVMHVFHQKWHGIRSAVGVLPGRKVGVPQDYQACGRDRALLTAKASEWGVRKAVFHGYSPAVEPLLKNLCAEGIACYLVWHGNLAQLAWRPEVDFFSLAQRAAKRGLFRRAHMLKAGMDSIFANAFRPMLVNGPPVLQSGRISPPFTTRTATALVPGYVDIRKNVHTSMIGCARSSIESVLHYGRIRGEFPILSRCKRVAYKDHDQHLMLLTQIDVTVNVSVIDCHPMVEMEALAAGAMSVTGPLYLDALQQHPYTKLSVIHNPFDVEEIASRLNFLRQVKATELAGIVDDYRRAIRMLSLERYAEFLEL